ncbi:MAG: HAMP domain-containing sensor histidine kinase [Hyphomicrobiaceae bacterium]
MAAGEQHDRDHVPRGDDRIGNGADTGSGRRVELDVVAHELRAPLAAIQSMAEALSAGYLGRIADERHAGYVRTIAETARHALAVVENMIVREPSAPSREDPSPVVDLVRLAREVVTSMGLLAGRAGVRLQLCEGCEAVFARCKATEIRQILINLVANGIGHAGGGVTVRLAAGTSAGNAWVEVVDNGSGIASSVVDTVRSGHVLDASAEAGSAPRVRLGLVLSRSLAEANGGRLEISSDENGTRARVVLPVP